MKFLGLACCFSSALAWSIKEGTASIKEQNVVRDTLPFGEEQLVLITKGKLLDVCFQIGDVKKVTNEEGSTTTVNPQQISLVLHSFDGSEQIHQFKLRKNKACVVIPYAQLPISTAHEPLSCEIILSGKGDEPTRQKVFNLVVAGAAKSGNLQQAASKGLFHGGKPLSFEPLPEIIHQFSSPHKTVPAFIALVCSAGVFMLLATLFGGWARYASVSVGGFEVVALVASMEGVFLMYYLGLSIFGAITYASIIAPLIYLGLRRQLRKEAHSATAQEAKKLEKAQEPEQKTE